MNTDTYSITTTSLKEADYRPSLSDGSLEFLKWFALILMIGDHINSYLLDQSQPLLFNAGRLVMPLFSFILAYNLARPGFYVQDGYKRIIIRMIPTGLLAMPFFVAIGYGFFPLNIIFTLLLGVLFCYLIEIGRAYSLLIAGALLVSASWYVQYSLPGVLLFISIWMYFRYNNPLGLIVIFLSLIAVSGSNGNPWAFAAIPLVLIASRINVPFPRIKHIFYPLYPLHLWFIWFSKIIGS